MRAESVHPANQYGSNNPLPRWLVAITGNHQLRHDHSKIECHEIRPRKLGQCWRLSTTLERAREQMLYKDYYRIIAKIRPQIESPVGGDWPIHPYPEVERLATAYEEFDNTLWAGDRPAYCSWTTCDIPVFRPRCSTGADRCKSRRILRLLGPLVEVIGKNVSAGCKLHADAGAGFHHLYGNHVYKAACWAHARRKFHDIHLMGASPTTTEALARIGAPYAIEDQIRGKPVDVRLSVGQE